MASLTVEQAAAIKKLARKRRISQSELLRDAAVAYLASSGVQVPTSPQ